MTKTLTIIGYEQDDCCAHCGRKLVHCVKTAELGLIGADCFNKLIAANKKRFSGNGKPGASLVRDYAKMVEFRSADRLAQMGYRPGYFTFEVGA